MNKIYFFSSITSLALSFLLSEMLLVSDVETFFFHPISKENINVTTRRGKKWFTMR